ncbi:MFS transporter [Muricauda sp. JGD-17]|uniref:MFS transporter n=1 Tax=Flagellimonas ochracea TaxID=2696472 RepID=A0A964TCL2_9FLAO|nr:MFS transporter [Allomuricauda ochracea]NAY92398.1 MFS transporter [Allomuricauda ochracea]
MDVIEKILLVKPKERTSVLLSFFFFFSLLCAYFVLRPIRDEMGIQNGAENMQWLFTGTFLAMLFIVPVFGLLNRRYSPFSLLLYCYTFFFLNILGFYGLFHLEIGLGWLPTAFFIWISVFNLFVVSLFWSFMADLFSSFSSKRVFGVIASGGSLGAISGPLLSNYLSYLVSFKEMLLVAALLLSIGIGCMLGLFSMAKNSLPEENRMSKQKRSNQNSGLFYGISNTFKSNYLLGIATFVLLYTSISTFLYFEQAHLLEVASLNSGQRISYFSKVDLATNTLAIVGQLLFTSRIIKKMGLALTMAIIPLLVAIGLFLMGFKLSLILIAVLLIVHRAGNFFLLRPSKEILFTVTSHEYKYQSKNFIDTAIYRGGDAITGWFFAGLTSLGLGLSTIALVAVPLALLWSYNGLRLGLGHAKRELNTSI